MKKVLFVLLFLLTLISCKGQPVIDPFIIEAAAPAGPDPILDGIIVSYDFEDTGTTLTDAVAGHNMTNYNTPAIVAGKNGNALMYENFAGAANWSEVPYNAAFKPAANEITILVDFYPTAQGGAGTSNIVGLYERETSGNHIWHAGHRSTGALRFRTHLGGIGNDQISTETIPLNEWSRIIMRWKTGEGKRIVIDGGTEQVSGVVSGSWTTTEHPLMISMRSTIPGSDARMINGRVDNVMIWGRKLTDAEVTQLFTGDPTYAELSVGGGADTTAPTVNSITVEDSAPTDVVISFNEIVSGTNLGFTIAGTTSTSFSSISGSGTNTITGVLATAVAQGETPTLAYSSTTGDFADAAGNDLATFSATTITNNVGFNDGHSIGNDLFYPRAGARFSNSSTDITDWFDVGTVSYSANSNASFIRSGTTSLSVSGTTTGQEGALIYDPAVIANNIAVGETVKVSGYVYITDAATADPMEIRIYHQSYALSTIATLNQTLLNQWQYFSIEHTRVNTGAFSLTIKPSDGAMYVDDMAIRKL